VYLWRKLYFSLSFFSIYAHINKYKGRYDIKMLSKLSSSLFQPNMFMISLQIDGCNPTVRIHCIDQTDGMCVYPIAGRAAAEAVSRWHITAELWVLARVLWWAKWQWNRFFSESFGFAVSVSFHRCSVFTRVSSGGWTEGPLAAAVPQTHSLTPSQIVHSLTQVRSVV
jgi:hypothetical protein